MKIHIVQKGDTLWKIAKQYGVDFEELKRMNTQLSNPEQIMPGMKIKIPGQSNAVEKNKAAHHNKSQMNAPLKSMPAQPKQEMQQPAMPGKKKEHLKEIEVPLKAMPSVPVPVIEHDDVKPPVEIQPEMPVYEAPPQISVPPVQQPQMPQPQPQQQMQMPKIEFDMVQNQIYQQMQQMPQPQSMPIQVPIQQAPCPETPSQPQIQILPVYFYPIMPPMQQPMMQVPQQPQPPVQHHEPMSVCGTVPSPCGVPEGYGQPQMHHYVDHGMHGHDMHGSNNVQNSWNFIPAANPYEQHHAMMDYGQQCSREAAPANLSAAEVDQPSGEEPSNPAAQGTEPQDRTYYESMPRYFDEQNLYSPPAQSYGGESGDARNNSDDSNAPQNPEQY